MLTPPMVMVASFSGVGVAECTGSSMVEVFVLGIELVWGDCAELDSPGVGGASFASFDSRGIVGESTRS
jgi:hypothetical protein